MTTLNISIPESMKNFVEAQANSGEFTVSEYVRHLIRKEQERETQERSARIAQYLALCEQQIARGECAEWSLEEVITAGERKSKTKRQKPRKKR